MMTIGDINKLPERERAVTRASYRYYRAVLNGAPVTTRQRLRQSWLIELQRCWPEAWSGAHG